MSYRKLHYKGFVTIPHYSEEDNVYYGSLLIRNFDGRNFDYSKKVTDLVTWESDNWEGIEKAFHETVDYYLEVLDELDKEQENRS